MGAVELSRQDFERRLLQLVDEPRATGSWQERAAFGARW
jgi:hypothetical protein